MNDGGGLPLTNLEETMVFDDSACGEGACGKRDKPEVPVTDE